MTNSINIFLASGAGAAIGGMIGSWLVTRWQFARIRELEDTILIIQKAIVRLWALRGGS
jgi:hypothetical protein